MARHPQALPLPPTCILAEETTVQDALDFMMAEEDAVGPPQFEFVGGAAPMAAGLMAWYEMNFESG